MFRSLISLVCIASVLGLAMPAAGAASAVQDSGWALAGDSAVTAASFDATNDGSLANFLVVAAVSETSQVTGMTFGGVNMTELFGDTSSAAKIQFFGLATSETSGTVDVTYSGNIWGTQIFGYAFLDGVNTASPLRASGSGINDPGTGSVSVSYSVGAATGDFAMLASNQNNRTYVNSVSPSDITLFSDAAGASFSGLVAYDADLVAGAYSSEFTFVGATNRELAAGVILAAVAGVNPYAWNPDPWNHQEGVGNTPTLSWSPGDLVQASNGHDVYFGETFGDVNDASSSAHPNVTYQNVDVNSCDPGPLEFGKTYYWRVDELNDAHPDKLWKGSVWDFSIEDYLVVDNMESYGDADTPGPLPPPGSRIWYTWKDGEGWSSPPPGFGGNGTGAVVDVNATAYNSLQSMECNYDNDGTNSLGTSGKAFYSEIEADIADLGIDSDWTASGIRAMYLWYLGRSGNAAEPMYVTLSDGIDTAMVINSNPNAANAATWTLWRIDLQEFVVDNPSIDLSDISKVGIGFGVRGNTTTPGGSGRVRFDDIRLYPSTCIEKPEGGDLNDDCVIDLKDFAIMAGNWPNSGMFP
jgi:hypothetical protein